MQLRAVLEEVVEEQAQLLHRHGGITQSRRVRRSLSTEQDQHGYRPILVYLSFLLVLAIWPVSGVFGKYCTEKGMKQAQVHYSGCDWQMRS